MNKDKCPLCGGEKIESTTSFTADFVQGVVIVRDVPALDCNQCGEEWISSDVSAKLEEIVSVAKKQKQEVFVAKYNSYLMAS